MSHVRPVVLGGDIGVYAIARQLQTTTGISITRLIRTLRPLRQVTIQIAGQTITAQPHITPDTTAIIENILGH